jgi:hypothetical protein
LPDGNADHRRVMVISAASARRPSWSSWSTAARPSS